MNEMTEINQVVHVDRADDADPSLRAEATDVIDMDGRCLVMTSSGRGTPTVVLETGLGAESAEWSAVQRGVAPYARVVRYDRAGRGASDPAPQPRSANELVDDLAELLRRAKVAPRYVLVGHSLGGLLMRVFAERHRSSVAGLVLADAMHEDQFDVFGPLFPPPLPDEPAALTETRQFWTGGWRNPRSTTEGIDLVTSCAQARVITSLGDLPLHVLTAGTFLNQPLIPQTERARLQRRWDDLQMRLFRLSSDAISSRVASSGHFVQREAPERVVEAIRQMLVRVTRR